MKKLLPISIILLLLHSCDTNKKNTLKQYIDPSILYGVWAFEISDPHAAFMINEDEFYMVDVEGNGSVNYTLKGNELKVFYDGFTQWGKITSVTTDSLKIKWRDTEIETKYVRFPDD